MKKILSLTIMILLISFIVPSYEVLGANYTGYVSSNTFFIKNPSIDMSGVTCTGLNSKINRVSNPNFVSPGLIHCLDSSDNFTVLLDEKAPLTSTTSYCKSSFYYVKYTSNNVDYYGYLCGDNFTSSDEYSRPWTTPKKSILGGAKYIASSYISQGQDSIYLKKFNVNPKSTSPIYTHQYQTNLTAPLTEAKSSYKIYSENNLLNQPLVFTIPIYNNMPSDAVAYPGLNSDTSGIGVKDTAFESLLDEQSFSETYKKKLRELHEKHPNWVFQSLNTGLDWNNVVASEQPNSYVYSYSDSSLELLESTTGESPVLINGQYYEYTSTGIKCKIDNGSNYCLKEGSTWYLANTAATSYYLDPRNFLTEDKILMFEKLSFSELHTESVLQSYLNGTFMEGKSALDNQTYGSIFVEAGKSSNVSAIYLASLAIQEVGITGSVSTTGNQFTWNGNTYAGLYNFYNIGAFSSSSNPVLQGLYWANAGSLSTIVTNANPSTITESGILSKFGLTKTNGYVTGISLNSTVLQLKSNYNGATVVVTDSNGNSLSDNTKITTGSKIIIKSTDGTEYTNTIVIYGDINGDGSIDAFDLLYIRKHLLNTYTLTGANLQAAHVAKNLSSDVVPTDLLYLRKYLLDSNSYKIIQ